MSDTAPAPAPTRVIGDTWRERFYLTDEAHQPRALSKNKLVPGGFLLQPAILTREALTLTLDSVEIVDDDGGVFDLIIRPPDQTGLDTLSTGARVPAPVRVQAFVTDSLGQRQTIELKVLQPVDPLRSDLTTIVLPTAGSVAVVALTQPTSAETWEQAVAAALIFGGH